MGEPGHLKYQRRRNRRRMRRFFFITLGALAFMGVVLLVVQHLVRPGSATTQTSPDSGDDNSGVQFK